MLDTNNVFIAAVIESLPSLQLLDLSNTRGLGKTSIGGMFSVLNNTNIKYLCLRKFQLPGGEDYLSDFTHMQSLQSLQLPMLMELDMSENGITRFPPGVSHFAPNLQILDFSNNVLLDSKNIAFLVEGFQHKSIKWLILNDQGYHVHQVSRSNNLTKHKTINRKHEFLVKEIIFFVMCINSVSGDNYTSIVNSSIETCLLAKCVAPNFFQEVNCLVQTFVPTFRDLIGTRPSDKETFHLPFGKQLTIIEFSGIHWEESIFPVKTLLGDRLSLAPNNSVEEIRFTNNIAWVLMSSSPKILQGFLGVSNFDKVKIIDLSSNGFQINFENLRNGNFPILEQFILSNNVIESSEFCLLAPNMISLDLSYGNISFLDRKTFFNCSGLQIIDLNHNQLNKHSTLDMLDLNGTENLQMLNISHNYLEMLGEIFMNKIDNYSNIILDLSHNPLVCDCSVSSRDFTKWLYRKGQKGQMKNFKRMFCTGHRGTVFVTDIDFQSFYDTCQSNNLEIILTSVCSTLAVIAFTAFLVCLYRIRWRIKYFYFKWGEGCNQRQNSEVENVYDVYVAYCTEDRFWVHNTLRPSLENKYGFKLCIKFRDFVPGENIFESITSFMALSREIILVMSDNFLTSEQSRFELDHAVLKVQKAKGTLKVITLGDITGAHLSPLAAHVLEVHHRLDWPDDPSNVQDEVMFWKILLGLLYGDWRNGTCCCKLNINRVDYRKIDNESRQ